jgi:hypothetical protein
MYHLIVGADKLTNQRRLQTLATWNLQLVIAFRMAEMARLANSLQGPLTEKVWH